MQKRRLDKNPKITLYIDGPFKADSQDKKEGSLKLKAAVNNSMKERAKKSTYEYITYKPE